MKIIPKLSDKILPFFFNTRYRLARMTRKHRHFGNVVKRMFFEDDDMIVLPKDDVVRNIDVDIDIDSAGDRSVLPSDIVKGVIDRAEDVFIMDHCLCRKSNKCKNYPIDKGCIFLGKGTRKIPTSLGHVATREEAKEYIDECGRLGLVHIIGRNKLDSIWLSTGKNKDLMTICNCCPCCCLWNIARDVSDDISATYKRLDGVNVSVDTEKCVGCGSCQEICFVRAVSIVDGKCSIDSDKCRGCGRCVDNCPGEAISITFDKNVVEGEIERVSLLANLSDGR